MWQLKIVGWGHCLNIIKASVCVWMLLALVQFIIMFLGKTLYMHTLSLGVSLPCIVGSKYTAVLQTVSLTWKHVQYAEVIVGECWGGLRLFDKSLRCFSVKEGETWSSKIIFPNNIIFSQAFTIASISFIS